MCLLYLSYLLLYRNVWRLQHTPLSPCWPSVRFRPATSILCFAYQQQSSVVVMTQWPAIGCKTKILRDVSATSRWQVERSKGKRERRGREGNDTLSVWVSESGRATASLCQVRATTSHSNWHYSAIKQFASPFPVLQVYLSGCLSYSPHLSAHHGGLPPAGDTHNGGQDSVISTCPICQNSWSGGPWIWWWWWLSL